jgi:pyruvate formate lyase activating enzyme
MTAEALETIQPYLDAANVDLKFFTDVTYQKICRGRLQPVVDSIRRMKKLNIWVEITTLIIPGLNDCDRELNKIAKFISGLDKEIPWHISRFHPDYKYTGSVPTPLETLDRAHDIGKKNGLKYIYLGNVPGEANTYCPSCGELLIRRTGYIVGKNNFRNGRCLKCRTRIKGIWD